MTNILPPLPASDMASMAQNRWNPNYETRSANFWSKNQVEYIEDKPMQKCSHFFKKTQDGVICTKCHFGLIGNLPIQDGKLALKGIHFE